ncbi:hypothetical protein BDZ45DRAFT_698181 [Acephala macrosclerotiorum]|nr:hypothetical protein BDZ45DRAFT_698181 [Acephala macrosclerotiorum]
MHSLPRSITLLSLLVRGVLGYTTFTPNCSILEHPVNFVNSADSRGTLNILWSCLFTILACTWTILHLNVPEQRDGQDPGWRGDLKWTLKAAWTKTKWMLITMLAPELLLSIAIGNLANAKEEKHKLKGFVDNDGVPWSLTHSMFVDMGGFVLRAVEGDPRQNATVSSEISEPLRIPFSSNSKASGNHTKPGHPSQTPDIIKLASLSPIKELAYPTSLLENRQTKLSCHPNAEVGATKPTGTGIEVESSVHVSRLPAQAEPENDPDPVGQDSNIQDQGLTVSQESITARSQMPASIPDTERVSRNA